MIVIIKRVGLALRLRLTIKLEQILMTKLEIKLMTGLCSRFTMTLEIILKNGLRPCLIITLEIIQKINLELKSIKNTYNKINPETSAIQERRIKCNTTKVHVNTEKKVVNIVLLLFLEV